jgi:hypothetical protein
MHLGEWMREDNPLIVDGQARRLPHALMWVTAVGVLAEVVVAADVCTVAVKHTSDNIKN